MSKAKINALVHLNALKRASVVLKFSNPRLTLDPQPTSE